MGASALNLPNLLSLSRVFLAPLVVVFLTLRIEWGDLIAGAVFILAALTDTADGYIARKHGIVTNLGKFIDPLADKVLITAALVGLVELQRIPAWMVVLILAREFLVTGLRMIAAAEGVVLAASRGGKAKTVSQIIAIVMMIFDLPLARSAMWVALLLTVWSGMDYLMKGWSLLSTPPAR
ncbi:MAG: CDP-diacylglycerol--glycerol-3-phosphate 3-phosphatidyltransferase [Synergistaceae bacterium]|nr:CDP-diacylglycerol--glycerol-3-phosphate 3-phosphatidyltransferase [Synergistaceae bacterium]